MEGRPISSLIVPAAVVHRQAVRDLSQRFALGHPRLGPGSCVICHGEEAESPKFEKLVLAAPAGPGAGR